LLQSAISWITNLDLTDTQWSQASLPIKDGGLGVRRVASLAPLLAFLASAAGTISPRTLSRLNMPAPPRAQLSFPAHIDHYSAF